MYRDLLRRKLVVGTAQFFPRPSFAETEIHEARLRSMGRKLPSQYREFLAEAGGFSWNGTTFFGTSAQLENRNQLSDANERFRNTTSSSTVVLGQSDSHLYIYDNRTSKFGRVITPGADNRALRDTGFKPDSLTAMFTQMIDERLPPNLALKAKLDLPCEGSQPLAKLDS